MKQYEEGHAKNVANFERLLACVDKNGNAYRPVDDRLSKDALQEALNKAIAANDGVNAAISRHKVNVNARHEAFAPLAQVVIQINRMMKLMPVTDKTRVSVRATVRKMQGIRVSARLSKDDIELLKTQGKDVPNQVSAAQTGFDNRVNHFAQLITLLELTDEYTPNEEHLQPQALNAFLKELRNHNLRVKHSEVDLRRARMERDRLLYSPIEGLCAIAQLVKTYLYVVFGKDSGQCKEVMIIRFSKRKFTPPNVRADELENEELEGETAPEVTKTPEVVQPSVPSAPKKEELPSATEDVIDN